MLGIQEIRNSWKLLLFITVISCYELLVSVTSTLMIIICVFAEGKIVQNMEKLLEFDLKI